MQVEFTEAFNYTFPSRAVVSYRKGWAGAVKREVGEAAIAAGRARKPRPQTPVAASDETQ